jgi:hypothetical protein
MRLRWRNIALTFRIIFWICYGPFWFARRLSRWTARLVGTAMIAGRDSAPCHGCGEEVSFLGRWECGFCGYGFDGFGFARCEVCGAVPPFLSCQTCGAGIRNPALF